MLGQLCSKPMRVVAVTPPSLRPPARSPDWLPASRSNACLWWARRPRRLARVQRRGVGMLKTAALGADERRLGYGLGAQHDVLWVDGTPPSGRGIRHELV